MMKNPLIGKCLAVGIILLFVGTCIIPAIAQDVEKASTPFSRGNWLYVGGAGPGNYTKIQDAIDNASDEDTVYVYNGTYNEFNISIRKSIFLLGEDKYSTIIDANLSGNCINIFSDNVTVCGFTVRNADFQNGTGIALYSHNTTICDNIITNNDWWGIHIRGSNNNNISYNIISNNGWAGIFGRCSNQIIIGNKIMDNDIGIFLYFGSYIVIKNNNISGNNEFGMEIDKVTNSSIIQNNFFNNKRNAVFIRSIIGELRNKLSNEFYIKGTIGVQDKRYLSILRQKTILHIILFLLKNDTVQHKDILENVAVSPSTLSYHLKKLVKHNIIDVQRYGENKGYELKNRQEIIAWLIQYKPFDLYEGFVDVWTDLSI